MTMIMMANHAEPLDSSCTNTKYMSWVWRKGLEGVEGTPRLRLAGGRKCNCVGELLCLKADANVLVQFRAALTEMMMMMMMGWRLISERDMTGLAWHTLVRSRALSE